MKNKANLCAGRRREAGDRRFPWACLVFHAGAARAARYERWVSPRRVGQMHQTKPICRVFGPQMRIERNSKANRSQFGRDGEGPGQLWLLASQSWRCPFEEEVVEVAFLVRPAGQTPGLVALAHVEIAATGGADGTTGVLVQHEALIGNGATDLGQRRRDEGQASAGEDRFVGRDGAHGRHRFVETAMRRLRANQEEDKARVPPCVAIDLLGMALEIVDHRRQTDPVSGDLPVGNQRLAHTVVVVPVVGRIANRDQFPIRQAQLGRALHVGNVDLERIAEPDEFLALEHPGRLDLGPTRIAGHGTAYSLSAQRLPIRALDEISRHFVEGVLEARGRLVGTVEDRRIIPGEQHRASIVIANGYVDIEVGANHPVQFARTDARIRQRQKRLQRLDDLLVVDIPVGVELLTGGLAQVVQTVPDRQLEAVEVVPGRAEIREPVRIDDLPQCQLPGWQRPIVLNRRFHHCCFAANDPNRRQQHQTDACSVPHSHPFDPSLSRSVCLRCPPGLIRQLDGRNVKKSLGLAVTPQPVAVGLAKSGESSKTSYREPARGSYNGWPHGLEHCRYTEWIMLKEKIYAKIGELTIEFATLEHRLQSLLKILIGENNTLIGPFFIHELNLFVLLRKVGQIARYQLQDDEALLDDLERVLKRINAMRDLRNLLVHGEWHIDEACKACPVTVRDFKMKYGDGQWQELTETTFNEKKLTQLTRRLKGSSLDVEHLVRRLLERQSTSK
jgi:hypothetical protein